MDLSIYLPVAETSVSLVLLLGLGGGVGFLSGLFGVGGGFLMTPLLIMIGIPPTIAAASDSNQIVAAASSGMYAHAQAGAVDFRMGTLLLMGGLVGGAVGVLLIRMLRAMGHADFVITTTYVILLGGIGTYMFVESIRSLRVERHVRGGEPRPSLYARVVRHLPWQIHFARSRVQVSAVIPVLLGGTVGMIAAVMGVGGGFIMVPVMVYLLRMPMHVVVGTNLFQELFICVNITALQAVLNHTVDLVLAVFLLLGSVVGAQLGAHLSKRLKADQLKVLMALIVLAVTVKMLLGVLVTPDSLFSYAGSR